MLTLVTGSLLHETLYERAFVIRPRVLDVLDQGPSRHMPMSSTQLIRGQNLYTCCFGRVLRSSSIYIQLFLDMKTTMEAVSFLSRKPKMQPKTFQFAGTKKCRAVITQRMSVHRVLAERMIPAVRS